MPTFTVHEPPHPPADRIDRAASLLFVKDGFSWPAFIFAPFWMLAHRLWWPLLGYVGLSVVFELVRWSGLIDPGWATLAGFALHLLVGFEADTLRRWKLDRSGWHVLGAVSGRNAADCERRFYDEWLPTQPLIAPSAGVPSAREMPARRTPVVGSLLGIRS